MNSKKTFWFVLLLFGLLGVFGSSVAAQARLQDNGGAIATPAATPSDDEVNAVAKDMFCPVCENIPLDVCPTTACQEWRVLIHQKLSEGWNEQQIKEYFAAQYGDRVLSEPPRRGLNWLVYILPAVFFLAGVGVLVNVLRPKGRKAAAGLPGAPDLPKATQEDDPYLAQIEEELRKK
jgi:cytochrome c-type biogenesis protein CcmH